MGATLYYSGLTVDRASGRRGDQAWIGELLAAPDSTVLPIWRDHCLVSGQTPVSPADDLPHLVGAPFPSNLSASRPWSVRPSWIDVDDLD